MQRFTVTWTQVARDQLTELWLHVLDRGSLAQAADRIDAVLSLAPEEQGDELHEGLKSLEEAPLRVVFEVHHDDLIVEVAGVHQID